MREDTTLSCAGCSQGYAIDAWRTLRQICTLSGADMRPYVVAWPEGCVVDVRVCRTCGRPMARTASASREGDVKVCRGALFFRSPMSAA